MYVVALYETRGTAHFIVVLAIITIFNDSKFPQGILFVDGDEVAGHCSTPVLTPLVDNWERTLVIPVIEYVPADASYV